MLSDNFHQVYQCKKCGAVVHLGKLSRHKCKAKEFAQQTNNSAMDAIAAIERRYAKYVANEECCALRSELRELLQQHQ